MNAEKSNTTSILTEEGKLRRENKFLQDRVTNLEAFKKNFFTQHYELIDAKERISQLEEQLELDKLKQNISFSQTENTEDQADNNNELLDYFNSALTAASLQDLVMSLFQSADGLAKDILVQIRDDKSTLEFCLDDSIKAENLKIIKAHWKDGDVVQLEGKTILNYKHLSLIYSPVENSKNITPKQLQQYMKIVSLGANTRTSTLKQRTELNTLRNNIYKIFKKMNQSFDILQGDLENNVIAISTIYSEFMSNLENNLLKMKIDKSHLSLIDMILKDTKSELLLALTKSMTLDKDFLNVLKRLENAYAEAHNDR